MDPFRHFIVVLNKAAEKDGGIDMNKVVTLINEGEKNLKLQNHFSSILNVDQTVQFFKYHKDHSGAPDNARVHSCLGPLSGS